MTGHAITVIVRDRDLSDAQLSGMDWDWFAYEINERTKWCDFAPLVTTCTDGDNGGWFRNTNPRANFWQYFYTDLLERRCAGSSNIRPVFIDEYLYVHGAHGRVRVSSGAWNSAGITATVLSNDRFSIPEGCSGKTVEGQ